MPVQPLLPQIPDEEEDPTDATTTDGSDPSDEATSTPAPSGLLANLLAQKKAEREGLTQQIAKDNADANSPSKPLSREQLVAGSLIPLLTMSLGGLLKGKQGISTGGQAGADAAGDFFKKEEQDSDLLKAQSKADLVLHSSEAKQKDAEIAKLDLEGVRGDAKQSQTEAANAAKNPTYEGSKYDARVKYLVGLGMDPGDAADAAHNKDDYNAALNYQKNKGTQEGQERQDAKAYDKQKGDAAKHLSGRIPGLQIMDGYEPTPKDSDKARDVNIGYQRADSAFEHLQTAFANMKHAELIGDRGARDEAQTEAVKNYSEAVLEYRKYQGLASRLTQYGINLEKGVLPGFIGGPEMTDADSVKRWLGAKMRHEDPVKKLQSARNDMRSVTDDSLKQYGYGRASDAKSEYDATANRLKSRYGIKDADIPGMLGQSPQAKPVGSADILHMVDSGDLAGAYKQFKAMKAQSEQPNGQ